MSPLPKAKKKDDDNIYLYLQASSTNPKKIPTNQNYNCHKIEINIMGTSLPRLVFYN